MDEQLIPLGLVSAPRRQHLVERAIKEIGQHQVPGPRVRIQPRVVKPARSRYERKRPEQWKARVGELDVDFHDIIALVT